MDVALAGYFMVACDYFECCVLDWLEFGYGSLAVEKPDGCSIMDDRRYEEFVGGGYCLFALSPGGAGQGA